jgi:hypothetical protein
MVDIVLAYVTMLSPKKGFPYHLYSMGEIMIKGAKGAKVKVLFQGLHMTRVIFMLVYNLKFCILDTPFNNTF